MTMINKIKRYFALRKAEKRLILLGKMLDSIDRAFVKKGVSRQQRKQFWEDFIKRPESRKKFMEDMRNELQKQSEL